MSKKKKIIVGVFVALVVAGVVAYFLINKQDKTAPAVTPSDESGLENKMFIPAQLTPTTTDEGGGSAAETKPTVNKGNNF